MTCLVDAAGRPTEAADGIKSLMCVDSGEAKTTFYISMGKGIEGIKEEVERLERKIAKLRATNDLLCSRMTMT